MHPSKRKFTVYVGGELFSLKHLIGNAGLAAAIERKSRGRFRCVLPQDFCELRGRSGRAIRDYNLRALIGCDVALFNFDGADLDSGTVIEFMLAKFADVPAVLLRTDIRNAGDHRDEPWNLMASHYPRTTSVVAPSLFLYRGALSGSRRPSRTTPAATRYQSSRAARSVEANVALQCIRALDRVRAMAPVLPAPARQSVYDWLPLAASLAGKQEDLRADFARLLEQKVSRNLL